MSHLRRVWIAEKFHPIHIEALHWLNNDEFPRSRAVNAGLITGKFILWLFKRDKKIYQQYFKE